LRTDSVLYLFDLMQDQTRKTRNLLGLCSMLAALNCRPAPQFRQRPIDPEARRPLPERIVTEGRKNWQE
jgi:hypothetical protein